MMRRRLSRNILIGLTLLYVMGLMSGCGRKAPPKPPGQPPQAEVKDLSRSLTEDRLTLAWSGPDGNGSRQSKTAGFFVYRSRKKLSGPDCRGCPVLFERIGEISLGTTDPGGSERKVVRYVDTVEKGYRYFYKVVGYSKNGLVGKGSNIVEFDY